MTDHTLAVCAIVKDEAPYLREWIEFHRLQGVEHFYLIDNDSSDETPEILAAYEEIGIATWSRLPGARAQMPAYMMALVRYGLSTSWMAFIDADEFLFVPDGEPLPSVLDDYAAYGGVVVNWHMYGTSGHEQWAPGLVTERFTRRAADEYPPNVHVKSIVRPRRVLATLPPDPHSFLYKPPYHAVNSRGQRVDGPFNDPPSWSVFRINHYWSKSVEEAERKADICRADNGMKRNLEQLTDPELNAVEDPVAGDLWAAKLRLRIAGLGF